MASRKDGDEPHGADVILSAMAHSPQPVRRLGAKLRTSQRLFNLIISNIPGPSAPLYLLGCRAIRAYPIVPLDDGHAISIGITSVDGQACFGVYAQASLADDADHLAAAINDSISELHAAATRLLASQTDLTSGRGTPASHPFESPARLTTLGTRAGPVCASRAR